MVPLILLTDGCDEMGLPQEPNACLVPPLPFGQLATVIKMLLEDNETHILAVGGMRLHLDTHQLYCSSGSYYLPPKEFHLLETFLRHPARVLSRRFLMREVWETDFVGDTSTLYVHIHWLRKKIEPDLSEPRYLRTVRGVGYRFSPVLPEP
ncbi:MAG: response regulator transcription factor [Chloroflexota bacterium]|nr:response regulator transcription factor [Chloroflexota bacterium]